MNTLRLVTGNVTVDGVVPEKSLVAITPPEFLGADILEFKLGESLLVGDVRIVFSVLGVLSLDEVGVDSRSNKGRNTDPDGNLSPQIEGRLCVVSGLSVILLIGSSLLGVGHQTLALELGSVDGSRRETLANATGGHASYR